MPKHTKQYNVSIPEDQHNKIIEYLETNKDTLTKLGIRTRAQLVSALIEHGIEGLLIFTSPFYQPIVLLGFHHYGSLKTCGSGHVPKPLCHREIL